VTNYQKHELLFFMSGADNGMHYITINMMTDGASVQINDKEGVQ